MTLRTDKVSSLLQKEVGNFLLTLELPALVTISKVETSEDLHHSKVMITILPADEQTEQKVISEINNALPEMQRTVNRKLKMKFVPRVNFVVDYSQEYASHINELLKKTHDHEDAV